MRYLLSFTALCGAFLISLTVYTAESPAASPAKWQMAGNLSEACSCGVPCTCNFGQSPSPEEHCWVVASMGIEKGSYNGTNLAGLHLALGSGKNGTVFYVDQTATPAQFDALKMVAQQISDKMTNYWKGVDQKIVDDPQFKVLAVKRAAITQRVGAKDNALQVGNAGGFESDYLIGLDGKSPIMLLNNWSINITENIKGKTRRLYYKDEFGNAFDLKATNANQGKFNWTDQSPIYFR